jgi:ferredoxin
MPKKIINENLCKRCGRCVKICPAGAIVLEDYPIFDEKKCIFCYHCEKTCPYKAIECNWIRTKLLTGRWIIGPLKILFTE